MNLVTHQALERLTLRDVQARGNLRDVSDGRIVSWKAHLDPLFGMRLWQWETHLGWMTIPSANPGSVRSSPHFGLAIRGGVPILRA